ncbi:hypothetical protein [Epilithonimonas mollis]|uniref:Lipoprotein n=1 Tax=Epilithonimonas mollis TaxID=216903 RepID=A0A1M6U281_9FLAO|nr:hypothetical protein [Epilithonimonas mollis]SHK63188.1 hypothetical protein SAMN05444371_3072 [Epilithonimonas mollis]
MKKLFFILLTISLVMSCEKNDGKQMNVENRKPDTLAIHDHEKNVIENKENTDYCYLNVIGKDSLMMKYKITNGNVSGKLIYKNFEKDSSTGDISGKISGDTLKLNYKFASEGMISEQEVYFLQDSGVLLEGIGEYSDNSSSQQKYLSGKSVNYSKGRRLAPADCNVIK